MNASVGDDELVFLPLGGVGEIGMNLGLYGFGPPRDRTWLAVDFGIAFAGADAARRRCRSFPTSPTSRRSGRNLAGIVITHAHEDHFGALIDLWPRLRVPVYATAFTARLLRGQARERAGRRTDPDHHRHAGRPLHRRAVRGRIHQRHPFDPRSRMRWRSARRSARWSTAATGSSIRRRPSARRPTRPGSREIGDEGVLALICDFDQRHARRTQPERGGGRARDRRGHRGRPAGGSPSPPSPRMSAGSVRSPWRPRRPAARWWWSAGRCAASSTSPANSACSTACRRSSTRRPISICRAQGRGARHRQPGRTARGARPHRDRTSTGTSMLDRGDTVVFSSRAIPGNEMAINRIINALVGARRPHHHRPRPARARLRPSRAATSCARCMAGSGRGSRCRCMARRCILPPMPSLPASWACRRCGRSRTATWSASRRAPAEVIDEVAAGRLYRDGHADRRHRGDGGPGRRRLAFAGHVAVALSSTNAARCWPSRRSTSSDCRWTIAKGGRWSRASAIPSTAPSTRSRGRGAAIRRWCARRCGARCALSVAAAWGKKPNCAVLVSVV